MDKEIVGVLCLVLLVAMYAADSLASRLIIGIAAIVCFCLMCKLSKRKL